MCTKSLPFACLAGAAAAAIWAAQAAATEPVSPPPIAQRIIGGVPATEKWVVEVVGTSANNLCTGVAVDPDWVITAAHCPSEKVRFSDGKGGFNSQTIGIREVINSPGRDVKLLRLATRNTLNSYPKVNLNYTPREGDVGKILGRGFPNAGTLRSAEVRVLEEPVSDFEGGPAIEIKGVTGASMRGDSGGPLFVNGNLVGVSSLSDSSDASINGKGYYANLAGSTALLAPVTDPYLRAFVVGTDMNLWQKKRLPDGSWPALWAKLNVESGPIMGSPAVTTDASGLTVLAVTRSNKRTYLSTNYSRAGEVWGLSPSTPWIDLGGQAATGSGPAVVTDASGNVHVFVTGTDNRIWHLFYNSVLTTTKWTLVGAPAVTVAGSPSVVLRKNGGLTLAVTGADQHVYVTSLAPSDAPEAQHWEDLGGYAADKVGPTIVSLPSGFQSILVKGTDNQLWQKIDSISGTWPSKWTPLGAPLGLALDGAPVAVASMQGLRTVLTVLVTTADKRIFSAVQDPYATGSPPTGGPLQWTDLGGITAPGTAGALVTP